MPGFLLRNNSVVAAYPNSFSVVLMLDDGYELVAGNIAEGWGGGTQAHWAWACPGANGRCDTRDEAMAAFRAAWENVTDEMIAEQRHEQQWAANKYALWDAGYRNKLGKGPIRCKCGEMFTPGIQEQTMAHIEHITGRRAGT